MHPGLTNLKNDKILGLQNCPLLISWRVGCCEFWGDHCLDVSKVNSPTTWGSYFSTLSTLVFNNIRVCFVSARESTWHFSEPQTSILFINLLNLCLCCVWINEIDDGGRETKSVWVWDLKSERWNNNALQSFSNYYQSVAKLDSCWKSFYNPLIFGYKRVKNTSALPYLLNFILHILTHGAAYISDERLLLLLCCYVVCQMCTLLESRSELCYSLYSINVQGSVLLALVQGHSVYMRPWQQDLMDIKLSLWT